MRVNGVNGYQPSFGIKVPTKRVLESATGVFFDEAKVSYPAQTKLLRKVGNLSHDQLYSYHMGEAMMNMSKVFKQRYPNIAKSAERISKECKSMNAERSFKPKDELEYSKRLNNIVNEELKTIGKKELDVAPMSLEELGYDKTKTIAEAQKNMNQH